MNWVYLIVTILYSPWILGQSTPLSERLTSLYQSDPKDIITRHGYLDNALPVVIAYTLSNHNQIEGLISYGNNMTQIAEIDGHIDSTGLTIYEYKDEAVSTIIRPSNTGEVNQLTWIARDQNLQLSFNLSESVSQGNRSISIFRMKDNFTQPQIILRADRHDISIIDISNLQLRWMNYSCESNDCYEGRHDDNLENPIEFSIHPDRISLYPSHIYELDGQMEYENMTVVDESFFITYNYPKLNIAEFDQWIQSILNNQLKKDREVLSMITNINKGDLSKYEFRSYGDFFISLWSADFVSGYLTFRSTQKRVMETIPFTFDRKRKRFYTVKDIFKNDYNYPYFLKSYIARQKRKLAYNESGVLKTLIVEASYKHMLLSPLGIIYFTDFNTLYGRRHILLPFDKIESFIGDKRLHKLVNKKAK